MAHDVTSWFQVQAEKKVSSPIRKFTMSGSDYSDRVLSWPSFNIEWNNIKPVRVTMNLANEDQALNFMRTDKVNMQNSCTLQMGFTHPTSGDEFMDIFKGTVDKFTMTDGTIRMTLVDKFKQLSERVIGTSNSVEDYTTSNYLASDLAWWICTSHGGLDATVDSSNPDIDWLTFNTWAGVMSGDVVLMQGRFAGTRVLEALRKISRTTQTAIYQEENRIKFHRFSLADSYGTTLNTEHIINNTISIDSKIMTNRKLVMFDYDPTSRYHKGTVVEQDSSSVNSYGLRTGIEKDASLWFVNSQSALNAAQRDILINKTPFDKAVTNVPLIGMLRSVGEMIYVTDDHVGLSADSFRVMKRSFSMEQGRVTFNADASQIFGGFTLAASSAVHSGGSPYVSSLDGNKILT